MVHLHDHRFQRVQSGKEGLVLTWEEGQGPNLVIHHENEVLENMNEWSQEQHGQSGLTERSRHSTITMEQAEEQVRPPSPALGTGIGCNPSPLPCFRASTVVLTWRCYSILTDQAVVEQSSEQWGSPIAGFLLAHTCPGLPHLSPSPQPLVFVCKASLP